MARYEELIWQGSPTGQSRRERTACSYRAYLPDSLAERVLALPADLVADLSDADRAVGALQDRQLGLASVESVARLLLHAEAVGSSYIEGLQVSAPARPGRVRRTSWTPHLRRHRSGGAREHTRYEWCPSAGRSRAADHHRRPLHTASRASGGNARRALGRRGAPGAELDRRCQSLPRRLRPAAPRTGARPPRGPVLVHFRGRPPAHRAGRIGTRPVRDDPPVRRRERTSRARIDPPRPASPRVGSELRACGQSDPGYKRRCLYRRTRLLPLRRSI